MVLLLFTICYTFFNEELKEEFESSKNDEIDLDIEAMVDDLSDLGSDGSSAQVLTID